MTKKAEKIIKNKRRIRMEKERKPDNEEEIEEE
jgi:hypothetical protein